MSLLKVMWGAGHGYGASPEERAANWADTCAFLARVLGIDGPE